MIVRSFLLTVTFCSAAFACSLGGPFPTVCQAYAEADAVIIGKLTRVHEKLLKVEVERVFKGTVEKTVELLQGGTSCDRDYAPLIGKKMLLYLAKKADGNSYFERGYWSGGELENVIDELAWLRQLPGSLSRTRFSGFIFAGTTDLLSQVKPIPDSRVTVASKTSKFEVKTDSDGFFQIWDVPADTYWIEMPVSATRSILRRHLYGEGFIQIFTSGTGSMRHNVTVDKSKFRCGRIDSIVGVE